MDLSYQTLDARNGLKSTDRPPVWAQLAAPATTNAMTASPLKGSMCARWITLSSRALLSILPTPMILQRVRLWTSVEKTVLKTAKHVKQGLVSTRPNQLLEFTKEGSACRLRHLHHCAQGSTCADSAPAPCPRRSSAFALQFRMRQNVTTTADVGSVKLHVSLSRLWTHAWTIQLLVSTRARQRVLHPQLVPLKVLLIKWKLTPAWLQPPEARTHATRLATASTQSATALSTTVPHAR